MHFIETYLASVFYVSLPLGIVTSPGSSVLFTGKLMLLLLVYIREDAVVVRQPIYGLLIGNLLMVALASLMRHHALMPLGPGADRRLRLPRPDGRADGVGHGAAVHRLHPDHPALRALARLAAGPHLPAPRAGRRRGADLRPGRLLCRPACAHRRAGLRCCSAAGSRRWARSRSTACWSAAICVWPSGRSAGSRSSAAHRRRLRHADLSRALRGSAGAHRPRRADRRVSIAAGSRRTVATAIDAAAQADGRSACC